MKKNETKIRQCFLMATLCALVCGCAHRIPTLTSSSLAVPDVLPLGSVSRAHWHVMETNGEASDFILYRNEFVNHAAELSPYGRDHIMEIAARMPSVSFPVLVQRSEKNSNPQLDAARRDLVVGLLSQMGNADAGCRTFISQPYSDGIHAIEAEQDRVRFRSSRQSAGFYGGFYGRAVGF